MCRRQAPDVIHAQIQAKGGGRRRGGIDEQDRVTTWRAAQSQLHRHRDRRRDQAGMGSCDERIAHLGKVLLGHASQGVLRPLVQPLVILSGAPDRQYPTGKLAQRGDGGVADGLDFRQNEDRVAIEGAGIRIQNQIEGNVRTIQQIGRVTIGQPVSQVV